MNHDFLPLLVAAALAAPLVGGGAAQVVSQPTESALRNALAAGGAVSFACDGTITLAGPILITNQTSLDGAGHQVTLSGGGSVRVFQVNSGVTFSLTGLTIFGGFCTNGGGGIRNEGGAVNLTNCTFVGNQARAPDQPTYYGFSGTDAGGGAIYSTGTLTVSRCRFVGNVARGGAGALNLTYDAGYTGGGGFGGAIQSLGGIEIDRSLFQGNAATGGAGGQGGAGQWGEPPGGGLPGAMGGGAGGGAIRNDGVMAVAASLFAGNTVTGGAGGVGGYGFSGGPGSGAVSDGGDGGIGGDARGSAVFSRENTVFVNCTLARNGSLGGSGGAPGAGGSSTIHGQPVDARDGAVGTAGVGSGAIETGATSTALTNCTLAYNSGTVCGGLSATSATLVNTILATNTPCNSSATNRDAGHNLSSDASCAFTAPGSLNNTDVRLGPLADNGGPTGTIAPLPGSPAIGAADHASAPATDQRGFPWFGGSADIGACEYGYPPVLYCVLSTGGTIITLRGHPGLSCRLFTSPDLVYWTLVATNQFGSMGTAQFHDPGPRQSARFYRTEMP